jgi:hypothetical protein
LRSPTELVNAIRYVLGNAAHHFGQPGVDPYSSRAPEGRSVVAQARSWLLTVGWRRARFKPGTALPAGDTADRTGVEGAVGTLIR